MPAGTRYYGRRAAQIGFGTVTAAAARDAYKALTKTQKQPPKQRRRQKKTTVSKQIKDIKKSLRSDQACHTFRHRHTEVVNVSVNQASFTKLIGTNCTALEGNVANLRYYDPATPGTLVTANAATGTYTRQIHFKNIYQKCLVVNNYQVPVNMRLYYCTPKHDTSTTPESFYTAAVADQTISGAVTAPLLYPSDMDMVRDNWNMKLCSSKMLLPGQHVVATENSGPFDYDPSNFDTHGLEYQSKYKSSVWMVRLEGVLGHDTSTGEITTLEGSVDTLVDRKFEITYDAGVNLNDYSYNNTASTSFTNAGVVSNKPVSDNQSYSQA